MTPEQASNLLGKFENKATDYFSDEKLVKAAMQIQRDTWNDAIDSIKALIKSKNQDTVGGIMLSKDDDFDSLKIKRQ